MSLPSFESIRLDIADSVATVTLARPQALNAITVEMLTELAGALERADGDASVRAIVLTGEGARSAPASISRRWVTDDSPAARSVMCSTRPRAASLS